MIRLLGTDSDPRVGAELGIPGHCVGWKRRLLGIPPYRPPWRGAARAEPWTADDDALLGTMSDARVALLLGRSLGAVTLRRRRLEIAAFRPQVRKIRWTRPMLAALGRASDREVGERFGICEGTVKLKRSELGISARIDKRPVERTRQLRRLLRLPPSIARARTGLKYETIQKMRKELRIAAPRLADVPWTSAAIARLGRMPDAQAAREIGVGITSLWSKRQELGVPSFRRWRRWTSREIALLRSSQSDRTVAERLRRTVTSVRAKRIELKLRRRRDS